MPKETIHNPHPADQPFQAAVGWQRDHDVQVGIQVFDETSSILQEIYGGSLDQLEALGGSALVWLFDEGRALLQRPDFKTSLAESDFKQRLGAEIIEWVGYSRLYHPERDGIWVNFTRSQINDMIRNLRRARDQAYGRDE